MMEKIDDTIDFTATKSKYIRMTGKTTGSNDKKRRMKTKMTTDTNYFF